MKWNVPESIWIVLDIACIAIGLFGLLFCEKLYNKAGGVAAMILGAYWLYEEVNGG